MIKIIIVGIIMYFIGILTSVVLILYLNKKENKYDCSHCRDKYHDDDPEHLLEP